MSEDPTKTDPLSPHNAFVDAKAPYGRDEVKLAIINAAEELLMERGPVEITVREIAKKAGVKHPLIYRHFGSKDDLVRAVHARQIDSMRMEIETIEGIQGNLGEFFRAVEGNRFRQIALARAMLDGVNPYLLQSQFPVMQRFIELIEKRRIGSEKELKFDARILSATIASTALGWIIYEPFILAAANLENRDLEEVKREMVSILEELVQIHC